ncbi:hypothetical protein R1flu_010045 [Riccia fluitans]|uniref:Uncharacterized protein n=1 Tax=Riccia fluitans TaxID=41844 RepID=A0ABD1Z406_9MARC
MYQVVFSLSDYVTVLSTVSIKGVFKRETTAGIASAHHKRGRRRRRSIAVGKNVEAGLANTKRHGTFERNVRGNGTERPERDAHANEIINECAARSGMEGEPHWTASGVQGETGKRRVNVDNGQIVAKTPRRWAVQEKTSYSINGDLRQMQNAKIVDV